MNTLRLILIVVILVIALAIILLVILPTANDCLQYANTPLRDVPLRCVPR
jgi:hypothetical protein